MSGALDSAINFFKMRSKMPCLEDLKPAIETMTKW